MSCTNVIVKEDHFNRLRHCGGDAIVLNVLSHIFSFRVFPLSGTEVGDGADFQEGAGSVVHVLGFMERESFL